LNTRDRYFKYQGEDGGPNGHIPQRQDKRGKVYPIFNETNEEFIDVYCSSQEGVLRRERGGGERVGGEAMSHSIIERGRERQKGASGEREHLN
jgi:hypothetical protein